MGQSTNAILAFGFDLGEEIPGSLMAQDEDGSLLFDWQYFVNKENGIVNPFSSEPTPKDVYEKYFAQQAKGLKEYPVAIKEHCFGESPMYFLAVNGTISVATRGYPQMVSPNTEITDHQIKALKKFCKTHDIEWQEPAWYIFSYWG